MRLTPVVLAVTIAAATMSSAGSTQRPDDQIDPRSTALVQQAQGHAAAGRSDEAIDFFETAQSQAPAQPTPQPRQPN